MAIPLGQHICAQPPYFNNRQLRPACSRTGLLPLGSAQVPTRGWRSRAQTLSFPDGQFYPYPSECPRTQVLSSFCDFTVLPLQYHIHIGKIPPKFPHNNLSKPFSAPHSPSSCSGLAPLPGWIASSQSCLTWLVAPARA